MTFVRMPDLATRALGGAVVAANDDFYADRAALIMPAPAQPRTEFGYRGKIYDGWETRRRREPGSDYAIIRLGVPGIVHGVVVDTAYFRGNYPPEISVQATALEDFPSPCELAAAEWTTLVERSAAKGDTANLYDVSDPHRWTHVKLVIHPDGGVARLRVHGHAVADPRLLAGTVDLAAQQHGGSLVDCSNMFFSSPANLLLPGPARSMAEGWETARRREGGNDWVVIQLAGTARLRDVVVDTSHFLGNAPAQVQISGAAPDHRSWTSLVPCRPVLPDTPHRFRVSPDAAEVAQLRVDIYPDGGFARLRAHGELTAAGYDTALRRWLDALPPAHLRQVLTGAGLDPTLVATTLLAGDRPLDWASEVLATFTPR
ncbi:MAG: allantoicase [Pseudonocardiaceae bacterium]